jgi:hypothetical protein
MAVAVCDRFVNGLGIGLDGRVVEPSLLPAYMKTRKTKAGEVYVVQ